MSGGACERCLRRSALIGFLSARLSAVLGGLDDRLGGVLALDEEELIAAVAGRQAERAHRFRAGFDPAGERGRLARLGVGALCRHRDGYPSSLEDLADVPPVIYFTGGLDRLCALTEAPVATVVGTRAPSRYGLEVARELGRGIAVSGGTVVSGLALGVDAAAHRGALEGGGSALAVVAGGVDVPYPKANRALHERVRREGMAVSEMPPGHEPLRWSFPARNRIMAALGRITVVVEAAESSGSLITADFAAQLGRDLGAVPGQVTSRLAAGANALLRDGAAVIRSPQDVLDELLGVRAGLEGPRAASRATGGRGASGRTADPGAPGTPHRSALHPQPPLAPEPALSPHPGPKTEPALEPPLRRVLDLVEQGETIDGIAREAGLSPARARAALGRLEMMGLVARDGFAGYARTLARGERCGPILGDPATFHPRA